jgi:3-phenylpropionate/trans-cinnamate dioxygenase ferredoxin reductase component
VNAPSGDSGVVIVGAGLAGLRTVEALRRKDYSGPLTLIGDEPHPPYDRPPLSKGVLAGDADAGQACLADADRLQALGAEWRPGVPAAALDLDRRRVALADGTWLRFRSLVIATGASARPLPGGQGLPAVHTLRTLDDSLSLRAAASAARRICVLGGGVLGTEVAATLSRLPAQVTIVEAARSLLARAFPEDAMTSIVAAIHRSAGVSLCLGSKVTGVNGDSGGVTGVSLAGGSSVAADLVVVALGVQPAVGWLSGSGIKVDDGVVCDEFLRTEVGGVFAIGDVARKVCGQTARSERLEHWTSAVEQADVVAHNVLADQEASLVRHVSIPYVWSDQFDRRLQILGRPAQADDEVLIMHDEPGRRALALYGRGGTLVGVAALGMPRPLARARVLIEQRTSLAQAQKSVRESITRSGRH